MKKYIALLKGIGIPEKAGIIYLALLEKGKSSISEIQNTTALHRVEIYRLLPLLIEEGFVLVSVKGKRKQYSPTSPIKIQEAYKKMEEENKGSINKLVEKFSYLEKKPNITYNEGKKGITGVFNDIVDSQNKGDIFYRISSETNTDKINNEYLPKNYREKRDKKQLERYVIMSSKASKIKKPRLEREIKIIPESIDEFDSDIVMSIYANKLSFIDFNSESSIIIENKQIADFQKKIFRLLYKSLK